MTPHSLELFVNVIWSTVLAQQVIAESLLDLVPARALLSELC